MAERCPHGMDRRFCAICNKSTRAGASVFRSVAASQPSLNTIVEFLNHEEIRATYGAVAGVLGVNAQSIGAMLGARRVEASWIVNAESGLPTGYDQSQVHPALFKNLAVIMSASELTLRMSIWQGKKHQ